MQKPLIDDTPRTVSRRTPYSDNKARGMALGNKILEGLRPTITGDIDEEFKIMIQRCWHHNAQRRPTFSQIVDEFERMLGGRAFLKTQRKVVYKKRHSGTTMSFEKRLETFALQHLKVDRSMVHRGKLLGKGSFAEVFECQFTNWKCALKVFKAHLYQGNGKQKRRFLRLIQVRRCRLLCRLLGATCLYVTLRDLFGV